MQGGGEIFNNLVFLNISLPMAILVVTKIFMCRLLIIAIFESTNLRPCLPKALTARQQYKCFILQNYVVMMSWIECYNAIVRSQLLVACSECRKWNIDMTQPSAISIFVFMTLGMKLSSGSYVIYKWVIKKGFLLNII